MGYLFNDITDLKKFVGGAANMSLDLDSLDPTLHLVVSNHIVPWLGQAQWDALLDAWTNDTLSTEEQALLPVVQRPLAMLAMSEYTSIGSVMFTESGFHRKEMAEEGLHTAYKYQENNYKDYMLHGGYDMIEEMLKFLEANKADYPDWDSSIAATMHRSLLLNYAADLRLHFSKYVSRYTYEVLRPVLEEVELFAILPLLGATQYESIKDTPDAAEQLLIPKLQKAIAHLAVHVGVRRHLVLIKGKSVVQIERLEPQSSEREGVASANSIKAFLQQEEEFANRHLSYIRNYLTENIDDFPLYEAYQDELAAAEAAAEEEAAAAEEITYSKKGPKYDRFGNLRKGIINL
jgi:hypothetical protein